MLSLFESLSLCGKSVLTHFRWFQPTQLRPHIEMDKNIGFLCNRMPNRAQFNCLLYKAQRNTHILLIHPWYGTRERFVLLIAPDTQLNICIYQFGLCLGMWLDSTSMPINGYGGYWSIVLVYLYWNISKCSEW